MSTLPATSLLQSPGGKKRKTEVPLIVIDSDLDGETESEYDSGDEGSEGDDEVGVAWVGTVVNLMLELACMP